ncbi:MAG: type I restriction enzyme endonuclease domain-containing protein [Thermoplasmatota archaeon]
MAENLIGQVMRGDLLDVLEQENVILDALRDLVRDEIKRRMREELDKSPQLREELKDAVREYYEAKVHEAYATLKFAKASAKLGVNLMPDNLRDELGRELQTVLEKDVAGILEKAL